MPVATQVWSMLGDHDKVSAAGADVAVASWAGVDLACLIRLDRLDDQRSEWGILHRSPTHQCPEDHEKGDCDKDNDDDDVRPGLVLLAKRIEAHGTAA